MGNQFKNVAVIACLKTFLFFFNVVFWLSGLLLLIMGLWAEFDLYKYMQLSSEFSGTAPHAIIGIAGLIVLVSSVAFSCIIKGQPVLLYIVSVAYNTQPFSGTAPHSMIGFAGLSVLVDQYGGFLACIFVMEVGVGASVACYRDTFSKGLYDGLTQTLVAGDQHRGNFDLAQSTLHCCGVSNYTDWVHVQRSIPPSCCVNPDDCITANYSHVYKAGCYKVIVQYLESNMNVVIGIAIGTALFPLVGTVLSCCLASYIKKSKYDAMN